MISSITGYFIPHETVLNVHWQPRLKSVIDILVILTLGIVQLKCPIESQSSDVTPPWRQKTQFQTDAIPLKMASLSIASLFSFFTEEKKSIRKGENHYKSGHVESFFMSQVFCGGKCTLAWKRFIKSRWVYFQSFVLITYYKHMALSLDLNQST